VSPPGDSTLTSPPTSGGARVRVRLLRVLPVGGARPTTVLLDGAPVVIGREGHVLGPLALTDAEASRQHAVVARDGDGWTVADQGSRNGTFLDGALLTGPRPLADGSLIRVGKTLIVYAEAELRADEGLDVPAGSALVGASLGMLRVHGEIALVAPHDVPVLILGETGVGKELVAEEIHRRSGRTGAFIPVNCAAISPQLAESELFGHVAGAFTGASRASDGLFVAADGGTLFLDEVGELPIDLQPKLLRALAKGEVRPVGSAVTRQVDVRIVAATLRDLGTAIEADTFRADLYQRLSGWRVEVPALRARREDVASIAAALLARKQGPPLSADAAEALILHDWPGNVRELEQVLAAAVIRAAGQAPRATELRLEHLPPAIAAHLGARASTTSAAAPALPLSVTVSREVVPTRDELCAALTRFDGNVARVAEHFGKDRQQVYRWARRHGIDMDSFREK
jgi:transcriptional regulator with GAF, ATPase, and Fis domain